MRVDVHVELGARRGEHVRKKSHSDQKRRTRDRQLRWLALALHVEELALGDQGRSYANIAQDCGVTRARISKLLGILDRL